MSAVGETLVGCEGLGLELGEKTSEDAAAKGKSAFPSLETQPPPLPKLGYLPS